ncbi:MAG: DUF2834 domain-containing protein [Pseudomonadota bacterium]
MSKKLFLLSVALIGGAFALFFCVYVAPAFFETMDIVGAFAAGFVNPFSTGYSVDVIFCAVILLVWVLYERSALGIRHGWVVVPLCFVPGVATAFAAYLLIRARQIT